jgi:hypothetical protein
VSSFFNVSPGTRGVLSLLPALHLLHPALIPRFAEKMIQGIETMHMIKKGQVKLKNLSVPNNVQLFQQLFGLTVKRL